jgi:diguanylate cyclase (GGDEF)-like protein
MMSTEHDDDVAFIGPASDTVQQKATAKALNLLHGIMSSPELDFDQRVNAILRLGTEHFGLPIGIFSKIVDEQYEIQQVLHPENARIPGNSFELGTTYCAHVINANDVCGFHHVGESEIRSHPCYQNFGWEAYLGEPVMVDGTCHGTLSFSSPQATREFSAVDIELVRLFASWLGQAIGRLSDSCALEASRKEVERLATRDPLTGLYNRRYMQKCLQAELQRSKRYDKQLVVGLLDYDNFKHLNDTYGHDVGNKALELFAKVYSGLMRETDVIARWDSEEFLILMPETGAAGALKYLQRLIDRVHEADLDAGDEEFWLRLSIGLGIAEPGDTVDSLVSRACIAMYESKQAGRDPMI